MTTDFPHPDTRHDREPVTVESVSEWLTDATETLNGLIDDLHDLKREASDERREALTFAASAVGQAWAQARAALTALSDVVPMPACPPSERHPYSFTSIPVKEQ